MDISPRLISNTYFTHPKVKQFFYIGNLELLKIPKICVIGSRKMSQYGKQVIENLCDNLTTLKIATISGFVEGVDFEVFYQSYKHNIATIAVLGYGFNYLNKELLNKLKDLNFENCLFISQFENDTAPKIYTFPTRDETLAYIADIVLVVESAEKSGTFYTVKKAFKENKKVYAAGGSIFSPLCKGNYFLLQTGFDKKQAELYSNPNDLLQNFHLSNKVNLNNKKYTELENRIIKTIATNPTNFDEICKLTNIESSILSIQLVELELNGEIICKQGVYYKSI